MHLTSEPTLQESTPPATTVTGKVTVVMPTYNEADNLPGMVAELLALDIDDLDIIIVDDNSPDGTGNVAERLARCYPGQIHVIHRPGKQGLGSAYREGFRLALENGASFIVEMDADFSHSPAYIPIMLEKAQECDVVVGSRYVPGGAVDDRWRLWRRFLSWFGNAYARTIIGLQVRDTTAGFKVFRRQVLEAIDLSQIKSEGYAFQIEMAYACQRAGFRVCEIPIFFEDRVIGSSKMDLGIVLEAIWRVWQIRFRH
ncbi:MAG: polyprenol monophosphomannose synthase [Chloroflexi bacterium]|nr:MAG: polyprenol monophosphomannose synthase [Chloroflexota bacterium]